MDEEIREEFQILNGYSEELKKALISKVSIYVYQLLKIADHNTLCDHMANKTESENHILHTSSYFWGKCAEQWIKYKVDRKKTWEELMTENDERFLKQLYGGRELRVRDSNNDEDDCA